MKIVHVMNWYIPDMGYQENFLPAEQQKLGHEVFIITSDRLPFFKGFDTKVEKKLNNQIIGTGEFQENGVCISRLSTLFEMRQGGLIFYSGLKRKLVEIKPDIVHAHGPYNFGTLLTVLLNEKLKYKLFIDDHSHNNNYKIDTPFKKIFLEFVKIFYFFFGERVKIWMPVAEPAKQILFKNFKIAEERIKIIPLGVATNRFFESPSMREKTRRELSLSENDILMISTGKFDESKDIEILIESFSRITKEYKHVKLLIIGNGPQKYMEKIRGLIFDKQIENSVMFKDFVKNKDLPQYYNAADIGIWPGDHTITAVESLAVGLPIIVPDNDMSYNLILTQEAGVGFKRKDSRSLTEAIQFLINNFENTQNIKKNALSLANNQLSWETIAKNTLHLYSQS